MWQPQAARDAARYLWCPLPSSLLREFSDRLRHALRCRMGFSPAVEWGSDSTPTTPRPRPLSTAHSRCEGASTTGPRTHRRDGVLRISGDSDLRPGDARPDAPAPAGTGDAIRSVEMASTFQQRHIPTVALDFMSNSIPHRATALHYNTQDPGHT